MWRFQDLLLYFLYIVGPWGRMVSTSMCVSGNVWRGKFRTPFFNGFILALRTRKSYSSGNNNNNFFNIITTKLRSHIYIPSIRFFILYLTVTSFILTELDRMWICVHWSICCLWKSNARFPCFLLLRNVFNILQLYTSSQSIFFVTCATERLHCTNRFKNRGKLLCLMNY